MFMSKYSYFHSVLNQVGQIASISASGPIPPRTSVFSRRRKGRMTTQLATKLSSMSHGRLSTIPLTHGAAEANTEVPRLCRGEVISVCDIFIQVMPCCPVRFALTLTLLLPPVGLPG